jgi:hypothetical protein
MWWCFLLYTVQAYTYSHSLFMGRANFHRKLSRKLVACYLPHCRRKSCTTPFWQFGEEEKKPPPPFLIIRYFKWPNNLETQSDKNPDCTKDKVSDLILSHVIQMWVQLFVNSICPNLIMGQNIWQINIRIAQVYVWPFKAGDRLFKHFNRHASSELCHNHINPEDSRITKIISSGSRLVTWSVILPWRIILT